MTEWGIVGVLITLFGFGVAVVTPIVKLNNTITKLSAAVENLIQQVHTIASDLGNLTERNADTHQRLFEKINDHETRISVLEKENQK